MRCWGQRLQVAGAASHCMVEFWGWRPRAAQLGDYDMSRVIAVLACGFTLAACSASLPSMDFFKSTPSTESLRIESEPPGAEAKTSQGQTCRTPCEVAVQTASNLSVTVALNGYQTQTVTVGPEGPTPAAQRDPDGGAASPPRLAPNPVYVELQAAPPVAPVKKRKTVAKKKPTTTASVPAAQPAPAAAAPAPMPAEPAPASSASYPWPTR